MWVASAVSLLACTSHSADEPRVDTPPESTPSVDTRQCQTLPALLPQQALIEYSRSDSEHLPIYDVAYVADADCPEGTPHLGLDAPKCLRLSSEAMQLMWTTLREFEVHRIDTIDRDGRCIHCPSRWITVAWPAGLCSKGIHSTQEISAATKDHFHAAANYLEGVSERIVGKRSDD